MGRRSHHRALGLWMNGAFVGTWSLSPQEGQSLHYDPAWLRSPAGRPLSRSLPFRPGNLPHRGEAVHAYFENLLPDSQDIRERVARRYRAGSTDAFDLLAQIGRDCVGALQILPMGIEPADVTKVDATPLSEADVARLLRSTVTPSAMQAAGDDAADLRISIAGAQEKTALLHFDGQWCLPRGSTPTTHIFKLPMGLVGNMRLDLRESIDNEWLCARILREYGLPVAACEPLWFDDMQVLSVQRFDRRWHTDGDSPWLIRLPQEDMCQATGTSPLLKYEADGGPGMDRIIDLLDGSLARDRDRRIFFQAQVLFWMLCAPDGHAKNFSLFLRPNDGYELTPLYDVLSAHPLLGDGPNRISPFRVKLAMAVRSKNAHWKIRDILRRHWIALGERHGIVTADGRKAAAVIDDLSARTPAVIQNVRAALPGGFPPHLADSILDGLQAAAFSISI